MGRASREGKAAEVASRSCLGQVSRPSLAKMGSLVAAVIEVAVMVAAEIAVVLAAMEAKSLAKAEALAADLGLGFHQMAKALAATEVSAKLACSQTCLVQAAAAASAASFEGASGASFVEAMVIEVVSAEVVAVVSVGYLEEASNLVVAKEKVMDLQKEA